MASGVWVSSPRSRWEEPAACKAHTGFGSAQSMATRAAHSGSAAEGGGSGFLVTALRIECFEPAGWIPRKAYRRVVTRSGRHLSIRLGSQRIPLSETLNVVIV